MSVQTLSDYDDDIKETSLLINEYNCELKCETKNGNNKYKINGIDYCTYMLH